MKRRHVFVLGPSGVGKTTFGRCLAESRRYLHLEIDRFPHGDGIDFENLREPWDLFYKHAEATQLRAALDARAIAAGAPACVVTFTGDLILSPRLIALAAAEGIAVRYLYGSVADCTASFARREAQNGRGLPVEHWFLSRGNRYLSERHPAFMEETVAVFDDYGNHRPLEELVREALLR